MVAAVLPNHLRAVNRNLGLKGGMGIKQKVSIQRAYPKPCIPSPAPRLTLKGDQSIGKINKALVQRRFDKFQFGIGGQVKAIEIPITVAHILPDH